MAIIQVFRKDTGEKVQNPEHWLDHPTFGEPFTRTLTKSKQAVSRPGEVEVEKPAKSGK